MLENKAESYLNTPLFRETMREFQEGNWETGLSRLQELEEAYPLEDELRSLRQDMLLRAKVDEYEAEELKRQKRGKAKIWGSRAAAVLVTLLLVGFGVRSYARLIQEYAANTEQQLAGEVQSLALAAKFRNAQNLLFGNGRKEKHHQ